MCWGREESDKRDGVVTYLFFSSSIEEQYLLRGVFRIHYLLKNADSLTHFTFFQTQKFLLLLQEYTVTWLTLDL